MTASRHQGVVEDMVLKGSFLRVGEMCGAAAGGSPGRARDYLAAPAVSPATMRRRKISTMITRGTVTRTPAAIWLPKGMSNWVAPVNLEMATVAVCICCLFVIDRAMRNSFQAAMK